MGGYLDLRALAGAHLALPVAGIADDLEGLEDGMEHKPILEDILSLHNPSNALRRCQFTIPGKPHGKGRPRFIRKGPLAGKAYTDKKTEVYENLIALAAANAWSGDPLDSPVSLEIIIVLGIPKGFSKKRAQEAVSGHIEPAKKPDVDNVLKSVMDGIEGIVYKRDAQVVQVRVQKKYGVREEVRVLVEESPMRGM